MAAVKEAFLARDALAVVVALVAEPLQRLTAGRQSTADANTVQLVLTFLRNLLVLPDSSPAACAPACPAGVCPLSPCATCASRVCLSCMSCSMCSTHISGPPTNGWADPSTTCHQLLLPQHPLAAGLWALYEARTWCSQARAATTGAGCGASCLSACWTTARLSCWPSWRSTPRGCGHGAGATVLPVFGINPERKGVS